MSEADLKMLTEHFEMLRRTCNTREKAIAQLEKEGLLDENGELPVMYRTPTDWEAVWD